MKGLAKLDILGLSKEATNVVLSQTGASSHIRSDIDRFVQEFAERENLRQERSDFAPWSVYRSFLPFSHPSSIIYKLYARLSDPITIFSISPEFTGHSVLWRQDGRRLIEARIRTPSDASSLRPDYEAESLNDNIRRGIVTCAALSQDGQYVALGFGDGAIEIANIDDSRTISQFRCKPPNLCPVWIEFIHGDSRIALRQWINAPQT